MKRKLLLSVMVLFLLSITQSAFAFIIKKIDIQGLQGLSRDTVLSYLPVKVGDRFDVSQSSEVIQELYRTGFFDNVSLLQKNNTLIIKVIQRPVLSHISVKGNKSIPTKQLNEVLRKEGFVEGQIFDPALLEKIRVSLSQEYFMIGKYNASVDTTVTKEKNNRVSVKIIISEGKVAKIRQIKIIGNHAFHMKELLDQFTLSTSGLFSFFTHNDQYSREKLTADLESLGSYYMDRGYLKFKVDSSQVSMNPDRSEVYITIHITEGAQYKLNGYDFSGKLILPREELDKLVLLKIGRVFSRQDIMLSNRRIISALSDKGYASADINVVPKIDDEAQTIYITFSIKPGKRVYVRHITFSENYRTNDKVLRRRLLQQEGSILSPIRVNESKRSLLLLPYIRDVQVTTKPVSKDKVDVDYKVTEQSFAEFKAGVGYSQLNKFVFNAGLNHSNILGTGNTLGLDLMHSRSSSRLAFRYYNPYYTQSGIGRGFSFHASSFNANKVNITTYATNVYGLDMTYNIPFRRDDSFQLGIGYENIYLNVGSNPSYEVETFVDDHGQHFYQVNLTGGWVHQGFDRSIFPTKGLRQSLGGLVAVPIDKNSLEYYHINYSANYYHPIYHKFIGQLRASVGYGDGYGRYEHNLPFLKHFYAGGMGSVRGYAGNTLGPRDSKGDPFGGNFTIDGTMGLVFPNPISENLRTILFVEGGNVYDASRGIDFNDLRYSAGFEFDWLSPMGVLNFSLAWPLNMKPGDEKEIFQFNIGTTF